MMMSHQHHQLTSSCHQGPDQNCHARFFSLQLYLYIHGLLAGSEAKDRYNSLQMIRLRRNQKKGVK
uniref:Uncharacterized protein n=1 Tax=Rhizophora mucronata TaxID=61149 RepID=A0A2P2K6K1_RHIMU